MGAVDIVTAEYMSENSVFADAFNFYMYNGEQVVDPDSLKAVDTKEIALPFKDDTTDAVQKYRDVFKSAVIRCDDKAAYVLLGIENQTNIHYAMPVRNMIYDALQYGKQVSEVAAKHKRKKEHKGKEEYLSGFHKDDTLTPVITLVIHFGPDKWDGPTSIHEMLSTNDQVILKYTQDYKLNLIDPAAISEVELGKFSSDLGEVLTLIKYSNNAQKFREYTLNKPDLVLDRQAAEVVGAVTNLNIPIEDGEEEINMCEAMKQIIAEENAIAVNAAVLQKMINLFEDGVLALEIAAKESGLTVDEFLKKKEEYEKTKH